jgi:two-component system, NtrC family, response regulator AtoC
VPLCLVVEDDRNQVLVLEGLLRAFGFEVASCVSGESAIQACRDSQPEVVLLDLGLPDADGLLLIPRLLDEAPLTRLIVITGRNSVEAAVTALRSGARHYLLKPLDATELELVIRREVRAVDRLELEHRYDSGSVYWGSDPRLGKIREQLGRLASSPWTPVLLEGATGTGKEVVARELHRVTHSAGQFVAVNSAAVPSELLESEMFGHERGAFTGAMARRRGCVELADEGTLFLDEIGEMATPLQAKLLRFLSDFRFRRVGGEEEIATRCRVIAATNRDVDALRKEGRLREDLFFRLAVVRIHIPPLRERTADIVPLAYYLLRGICRGLARQVKQLTPAAEAALERHVFHGNVRELRNRLERAVVLGTDNAILPADLDLLDQVGTVRPTLLDEHERLAAVLSECEWNISRAAKRLGVARHWLRYRIQKLQLRRPAGTPLQP